ncbi:hypothetical protein H0H81_011478 [Sphagnurus paluster]|uniref:Uncharacterized protein n=1 Tax=Sphagnurus paluster TaxID=117069 RepID=A0A9P7KKJ1_9AGAR|nr:hypothetical protein H0H81_011478 [Sphagnurus paluster]
MDTYTTRDIPRSRAKIARASPPHAAPDPQSSHQLPRRKHLKRSLGAGAFMKDETLRSIDGRILRHGKFDCWATQKRALALDEGLCVPNSKPQSAVRRRRQHEPSRQFQLPKTPPPLGGNHCTPHTPSLSPSGSSDESSDDGSQNLEWDMEESRQEWWRVHLMKVKLDIEQADEMFRLFIDTDQCDEVKVHWP